MSDPTTRSVSQVAVGDAITPYTVEPAEVQLFRFSSVTWNAHRIHYDRPYAESEGYPGVLVQSHLHGCFLAQAVLSWAGEGSRLETFSWQNRGIAVPGDRLTCTGTVTSVAEAEGTIAVELALEERNQDDRLCAPGMALVTIPVGAGAGAEEGA